MKNQLLARLFTLTLFASAAVSSANGADWGSLKGRLVFDGDPIKPVAINVSKDPEFCSKHNLVDETISVGEKDGLTNTFVYLYVKKGKSVDVHPDMQKPSEEAVVLDNKGCRFEPHVMTIRTGQEVDIKNSDTVGHNTNLQTLKNPAFNQTIEASGSISKVFEKSEAYPSEVVCNIHPWMKSYILIRDNPYMAITGKDGSFEIKNLPAGKHEFIFWHESKGNLKKLSVGGTKTSRRGRAKLEISADKTLDLGDVKVSAKVLGK